MKLSLCMIVKDEEETLGRCLASVFGAVDEIVIADTGSRDGTREIAERFHAHVFNCPWEDDFSAARNASFSRATGDYLLWLDADDVLEPEEAEKIPSLRRLLEGDRPDCVLCPYEIAAEADGGLHTTFFRERIVRAGAGFVWQGRVHECIAPRGKTVRFGLRVRHLGSSKQRGARNLHIYQKWRAKEALSARDLFYYGRELYYNGLYTEAAAVLCEMIEGGGWYVNQIEACRTLARCRLAQGRKQDAARALLQSLLYGELRAPIACDLAGLYAEAGRMREAVFWYESALRCRDHAEEGDFEEPRCRDLVPLLGLVCCHTALREYDAAIACHLRAEALFPDHPSVRHNRAYFEAERRLPPLDSSPAP